MVSFLDSKKIIIFGAGDIGKQALDFYGSERVAFFVDNSSSMAGKVLNNRLILSWKEYLNVVNEYETVVAIKKHDDVDRQLRNENIIFTHFLPDWQPVWNHVLERIDLRFSEGIGKRILIFGVEKTSNISTMILEKVRRCLVADNQVIIADMDEIENNESSIYDVSTEVLSRDIDVDEVIIADPWRSRKLDAIARSYFQGRARITNPFFQIMHDESNELISNPYEWGQFPGRENENLWNEDFSQLNDIEGVRELADVLYRYQPLFRHVEIETINRCNGRCSFCPVSVGHDTREYKAMSDELFFKIINELCELDFDGRVALFSNDEPFLDPKIIERHKYVFEHLNRAKMHLYTNGTLLTLDKFKKIIPYLDELIIDNYNQELKLNENSKKIAVYCEAHPELKSKVSIVLRKPDEILTSRGGDAPNRKVKKEFTTERCVLPFEQMIIRPDGKVSLCCNDPYGKETLGDLNKQTMKEVWYGNEFKTIRKGLMMGRGNIPHCKYCDTFYYSTGC